MILNSGQTVKHWKHTGTLGNTADMTNSKSDQAELFREGGKVKSCRLRTEFLWHSWNGYLLTNEHPFQNWHMRYSKFSSKVVSRAFRIGLQPVDGFWQMSKPRISMQTRYQQRRSIYLISGKLQRWLKIHESWCWSIKRKILSLLFYLHHYHYH